VFLLVSPDCARSQEGGRPAARTSILAVISPADPSVMRHPAGADAARTAPPSPSPPAARPVPRAIDAPVVEASPHAPPRILALILSSSTVRGGETVLGRVRTTSNVASVEVRILGFSRVMTQRAAGDFTLRYLVPLLPWWLHRTYPIEVVARNADGVQVTRTLQVTVE
jgi:hypothetical protein